MVLYKGNLQEPEAKICDARARPGARPRRATCALRMRRSFPVYAPCLTLIEANPVFSVFQRPKELFPAAKMSDAPSLKRDTTMAVTAQVREATGKAFGGGFKQLITAQFGLGVNYYYLNWAGTVNYVCYCSYRSSRFTCISQQQTVLPYKYY